MRWIPALAASSVRSTIVALGALGLALGAATASRAGTPILTDTFNFADYGNYFIDEVLIGTVPAGTYQVSVSSTVPLVLFELENLIYDSGSSYFPDGTYEGGDELTYTTTDFDVNPQALGKPYADTETAVVPPTMTFNDYYSSGILASTYTDTVIDEELSLATFSDGGVAVVTISAIPEPATWLMMLLGFFTLGWSMRSRGRARAVNL
jgi:hypothetical protein